MPTIGAAVDDVTKERFESAASARRTTASRLSASLIVDFLEKERGGIASDRRIVQIPTEAAGARGQAKTEQVFVRLEPYYHAELGRLAEERDWYRGTYLANLFYAHADRRPVLCDAEINAVRLVARQLADMGRNINQIAKRLNSVPERVHVGSAAEFELIRMLIDLESTTVKELLRANLRGWGVSDGEA